MLEARQLGRANVEKESVAFAEAHI